VKPNFNQAFFDIGAIMEFLSCAFKRIGAFSICLTGCLIALPAQAALCEQADVVVYGGTPGGVTAATQAARLKKDVILLEPTMHIGGMMANGLSKADVSPRTGVYGGLAAAFFRRMKAHYNQTDPVRGYYEPKFAESSFNLMLKTAGVKSVLGQRILATTRSGRTIKSIRMTSGDTYCANIFIDASYEGDLMARSGVSTILGRESRARYGETAAGVQKLERPTPGSNNTPVNVDPYVIPGDPKSGLLPGVSNIGQQPIGASDKTLMAFNYRLCLTKTEGNRVPFTEPSDYNPLRYETTARFLIAAQKAGINISPAHFVGGGDTVVGKYDMNSHQFFSSNVWHIGYKYVTSNEAGREEIRSDVRSHILGLLWFAQTDPRVPAQVRAYTAQFGFCADEFRDNGNFPRQIYVRQARRLIGQYVLTQNDLEKKKKFPDAIGLGYYPMDQHGMIRTVVGGYIADEVRDSITVGPYEIPYRSMLPKAKEITNLIVPVALSTSHVAYTSVRVEPTYMVLGQAAGAAAALASNGDANSVNITQLRKTLSDADQVMELNR
jgi:hypothetical protein